MNFTPNFRDRDWLRKHIFQILQFYYPNCIDTQVGGYKGGFLNDGIVYDGDTKHLVGTSRFIYGFSVGSLLGGPDWCRRSAEHGLNFLTKHMRDHLFGGYYWMLNKTEVTDSAKHLYGHAFVLLAAAKAYQAGIDWAYNFIDEIYGLLDRYFYEPEFGLYRDEFNRDWSRAAEYRGQNANMHLCEALVAAFEATNNRKFLHKAVEVAKSVTVNLAAQGGGKIWEHYDQNWQADWRYNTDGPENIFRPYGFVPGHFIEWSKLLVMLERYVPEEWMITRAEELYGITVQTVWDNEHGGLMYSIDPQGSIIDDRKYYWVVAEAIAASALLAIRKKEETYWQWYDRLFAYAWEYFIDREHGGWYTILNRQHEKVTEKKSRPTKADYHPISACFETIKALDYSE